MKIYELLVISPFSLVFSKKSKNFRVVMMSLQLMTENISIIFLSIVANDGQPFNFSLFIQHSHLPESTVLYAVAGV